MDTSREGTPSRPLKSILKKKSQFGPPPSPGSMVRMPPRKKRRTASTSAPPSTASKKRKRALTRDDLAPQYAPKRTASRPDFRLPSHVRPGLTPGPPLARRPRARKRVSIYEAVAGRISTAGRMPSLAELKNKRRRANSSGVTFDGRSSQLAKWGTRQTSSTRDTLTRSTQPLPPHEVLFGRKTAPTRYEEPEFDIYGGHRWLDSRTAYVTDKDVREKYPSTDEVTKLQRAHRVTRLEPGMGADEDDEDDELYKDNIGLEGRGRSLPWSDEQSRMTPYQREQQEARDIRRAQDVALSTLPSSDLLKALHSYASLFYRNTTGPWGVRGAWTDRQTSQRGTTRSMNETALLALGVLCEEACAAAVGKTGWRALVESANADDDPRAEKYRSVIRYSRRRRAQIQSGLTRRQQWKSRQAGRPDPSSGTGEAQEGVEEQEDEDDEHGSESESEQDSEASSSADT